MAGGVHGVSNNYTAVDKASMAVDFRPEQHHRWWTNATFLGTSPRQKYIAG